MPSLCEMCSASARLTCGGCNSSIYCSEACQKRGWEIHKLLCSSFKDFGDSSRPTRLHRRVILFPVDEEVPRFDWLLMDPTSRSGLQLFFTYHDSGQWAHLLRQFNKSHHLRIRRNGLLDRDLDHTICLMRIRDGLVDGYKPNQCVQAMNDGSPSSPSNMAGPLIARRMKELATDPNLSDDIDMTDFRHIIDALNKCNLDGHDEELQHFSETQVSDATASKTLFKGPGANARDSKVTQQGQISTSAIPVQVRVPHSMVLGVQINGTRQMALGKPKYEPIWIPYDCGLFHEDHQMPLSLMLQLPLVFTSSPNVPDERNRYLNREALALLQISFLCMSLKAAVGLSTLSTPLRSIYDREYADSKFDNPVVARLDRKPLYPEHVAALCTFAVNKVLPIVHRAVGDYGTDVQITKAQLESEISRAKFATFYEDFRASQFDMKRMHVNPYNVRIDSDNEYVVPFVEMADLPDVVTVPVSGWMNKLLGWLPQEEWSFFLALLVGGPLAILVLVLISSFRTEN